MCRNYQIYESGTPLNISNISRKANLTSITKFLNVRSSMQLYNPYESIIFFPQSNLIFVLAWCVVPGGSLSVPRICHEAFDKMNNVATHY